MPGTSQFLGQWEWDPAHVGVVVRLGTVEHVFQGLEGGLCPGRESTWVQTWPALEFCGFIYGSQFFLAPGMASSILCPRLHSPEGASLQDYPWSPHLSPSLTPLRLDEGTVWLLMTLD